MGFSPCLSSSSASRLPYWLVPPVLIALGRISIYLKMPERCLHQSILLIDHSWPPLLHYCGCRRKNLHCRTSYFGKEGRSQLRRCIQFHRLPSGLQRSNWGPLQHCRNFGKAIAQVSRRRSSICSCLCWNSWGKESTTWTWHHNVHPTFRHRDLFPPLSHTLPCSSPPSSWVF